MYKPHGWVKTPTNRNIPIWRYFKFERFVDLLEHRQLHFARLDQFEDAFEGVLPPATVPLAKDRFRHVPRNPGDQLTDWEMLTRDINRLGKLAVYANCWYMSEHESDAMWRLYGREGIAVQSTFNLLCASLAQEAEAVHVGEVIYLDFRTEQPPTYGNTLAVAYNKRKEFEHERELRAVVVKPPTEWKSGSPPYEEYRDKHLKGLKITVDLDVLVHRIYVAPRSSELFRDQVREAITQAGLDKSMHASRLDDLPVLL